MKKNNGITLIALIITIIILLILAGVTINLTLGENGLFNTAKDAAEGYDEKAAEEKLEVVLADLQAKKYADPTYNETTYINNEITKSDMAITGDLVLVDGYQFMIDRSVPKIGLRLGKGTESRDMALSVTKNLATNFTSGTITIEVTYDGELEKIELNGEALTIPAKQDGKYTITMPTTNGNYFVYVTNKANEYKLGSIEVQELAEDMTIYDAYDLQRFANIVNAGGDFTGKTITLAKDIDMSPICGPNINGEEVSWISIGTVENAFTGAFDGKDHLINNLYTNEKNVGGLFGKNNGVIKNLTIKDCTVCCMPSSSTSSPSVGAFAWSNAGTISNCSVIGDSIISYDYSSGDRIGGKIFVAGGVSGSNTGKIEKCYSEATIKVNIPTPVTNSGGNYIKIGGITGFIKGGDVDNCYNNGNIDVYSNGVYTAYLGGIVGHCQDSATVKNSYDINTINVSGVKSRYIGAIIGGKTSNTAIIASNNYYTNDLDLSDTMANAKTLTRDQMKTATFANILNGKETYSASMTWTSAYVKDENNAWAIDASKNDGYPILK